MGGGVRTVSVLVMMSLIGGLCPVSNAGVVLDGITWDDGGALDPNGSNFAWDPNSNTLEFWEVYIAEEPRVVTHGVSGHADGDPIIHIIKTVANNSTFEWTGYHMEITGSPGVHYVPGSATSNRFQTVIENANIVDFYAPLSVPIGDSVTFELDIEIPSGIFTFHISQTPIPEPSSALILGLGAGILLRRRRGPL